jgi:hypothetical protein
LVVFVPETQGSSFLATLGCGTKSLWNFRHRFFFALPLALFGFVCLFAGVAIIGWVLYNVFVERQKEYGGPSFLFGLGSFGIGAPLVLYGWFTLRSAARRKEEVVLSGEEEAEFEREEDDEEHAT